MSQITLWNLSQSFCTQSNHFDKTFRKLVDDQKILFEPIYKNFETQRLGHLNTREIYQHIQEQSSLFNIQIVLLGYANLKDFPSLLFHSIDLILNEAQLSHSFVILGSPIPPKFIPFSEKALWQHCEYTLKKLAENYSSHCTLINFRHHFNNSSYFKNSFQLNEIGENKLAHILGKTLLVTPKFGI
jgi:hypothetical protein